MKKDLGYLLLLLLCTHQSVSVQQKNHKKVSVFHRNGFPLLHTHANSCGRSSLQISRHSICDPDHNVGTEEERNRIDTAALDLYNQTKCDCDAKSRCKWGGFTVGIMLVSEMPAEPSDAKRLEAAQAYANHLRDFWNMGHCGDDIVVFYSVKEKTLATAVGNVTEGRLSKAQISTVQNRIRPYLGKGNLTDGFVELVRLYKIELQREKWLLAGWIVALIIVAVILLLIVIGAAIFYAVKSRRKDMYDTHSAKYQQAKSNDPDVTAEAKVQPHQQNEHA